MNIPNDSTLPIEALRAGVLRALAQGPVVITAPTGTGKSTQVPRWPSCKVLLVQPRRVAARNVALRIAQLERAELGLEVGYRVRDEDRSRSGTRVLVVTPGIVLRQPNLLSEFSVIVVDEVHERRLDTDLILALAHRQRVGLIAMSATVDGERWAAYLGGTHLSATQRTYPVEIRHAEGGDRAPRSDQLAARVRGALQELGELPGDVLVFLPGKGEIREAAEALVGLRTAGLPLSVRQLHGGLTLAEQAEALRGDGSVPAQRRVVLTTNVAETSLTVPGVRIVIDSGLVRRTSYHEGRSYLGVGPIAQDSAEQRAGRAGRTAPGACIRLWSPSFRLEESTPPEIRRGSLSPLLLAVAKLGLTPSDLSFLDAPTEYALEAARMDLVQLQALDASGRLTPVGEELARLPLDPWLARVLVSAREEDCLAAAIDLVSALEQPRSDLLSAGVPDEDLERGDCDLVALVHAVRHPDSLSGAARRIAREAQEARRRLRSAFDVEERNPPLDRTRLLRAILRADPRAGCLLRRRKAQVHFSSGSTEMELEQSSRVKRALESPAAAARREADAVVVLKTLARSRGGVKRSISITAAAPAPVSLLAAEELGTWRIARVKFERGRLLAESERIWAGQVIETTEQEPYGDLARKAIVRLVLQGSLYRAQKLEAERRLSRRALAAQLAQKPDLPHFSHCQEPPSLEDWLLGRLRELGLESGDDLSLLSETDLLPADVPAELAPTLDERFPLEVDVGDCVYRAEYDLDKRQVLLVTVRGGRKTPPPANYLPRFEGFKVYAEAAGSFCLVRKG